MNEAGKALMTERPQMLRFATWFLEAGWRLASVANLFDVTPHDLLDALDPESAR